MTITLTGSDPEGAVLRFSASPPQFGSLGHVGRNGRVTYTPAPGFDGTDTFFFTVNDGIATSAPALVTVIVTPVNDPPVVVDDDYVTLVNLPLSVPAASGVTSNDIDETTSLTVTLVRPTSRGALALNRDGSFTYTPNPNFTGNDSFLYVISDGVFTSSNRGRVNIEVRGVNAVPVAAGQTVATPEDTNRSIALSAADGDGDMLTFAVLTQPVHGTLSGIAPNLVYTPAANFHGLDTFAFTANDGFATSSAASIDITVTSVNDAPVATADSATTNEDAPVSGNVLGNDSDDDGPLTASLVSSPSFGTVAFNANGNYTYTPNANYFGIDSFTYVATDGSATSAVTTMSLTMRAVNDPPSFVLIPGVVSVMDDTGHPDYAGFASAISAGPANESQQTITFVVTNNTAPDLFLSAPVLSPTGTLSFTTNPGHAGDAYVTVHAMDSGGTANGGVNVSAPQPYLVHIDMRPSITSANTATFTAGQANSFTVTAAGRPAPSIAVTGALPTGVTLVNNGNGTATLAGTPAPGSGGVYTFSITATNIYSTATQSFTLTVNEAPSITSANNVVFYTVDHLTFNVTATGYPRPTIAYSGGLPAGYAFVDTGNGTATITTDADDDTGGVYALTFTATSASGTATQNFTLTLYESPEITSGGSVTFTAGSPGSFTVTTQGYPVSQIVRSGADLPSGVTFVDNGDGTATLAGTPAHGTGGTYNFTITANNSIAPPAAADLILTVLAPPPVPGVDESYDAAGNTQVIAGGHSAPSTPYASYAGGLLANESGTSLVASVVTNAPTALGGTISINSGGSFTYTPPAGVTSTTDTYVYSFTIDGAPAIATASFVLTRKIWYVQNDAGPGGNGVSSTPFDTLAAAGTASADGDVIYVMTGDGTTAGQSAGIALKESQQLIGAGFGLSFGPFVLAPAGTPPRITNTSGDGITLASGNTIRGLTVTGCTGNGIRGAGVSGLSVDRLLLENNGASGILLTSATGIFVSTNTTITGSAWGLKIQGGTISVGFGTSNTIANTTTLGVEVSGHRTGGVDIAANVTGRGIRFYDNDHETITLSGTQTLSTAEADGLYLEHNGSGAAFNFPGTLNITTTSGNAIHAFDNWGPISFSGTQNLTAGSGHGVLIYWSGAQIRFSGALTAASTSGHAVAVSEDQSSVVFDGTMSATTGSGTGFFAYNSGPVTVGGTANAIAGAGGTGISINGVNMGPLGMVFTSVNTIGATNGIYLSNMATANIAFGGGTIQGGTTAVRLENFSAAVTIPATVAITNPATVLSVSGGSPNLTFRASFSRNRTGTGISIANAGGTILVDGTGTKQISSTGSGHAVSLTNNTGTIRFANGNLVLSAVGARAFSATGSGNGIVEVTGTGNTAQTTSGGDGAVYFNGTNIGAAGVTFQSVSSSGAVQGIHLVNTGNTGGGFAVTGTGTPGSGGTIASSTARGVELNNTRNVSLARIAINNSSDRGVRGTGVVNFSLTGSTITGWGNGSTGVGFNLTPSGVVSHLSGAVTITGNTLTGPGPGIDIWNSDKTITSADISNNQVNSAFGTPLRFLAYGSTATAAQIDAATIADNVLRTTSDLGIELRCGNGAVTPAIVCGSSTAPIQIRGNDVQATAASRMIQGIIASVNGRSTAYFDVMSNIVKYSNGALIEVSSSGLAGFVRTNITNNTVEDCAAAQCAGIIAAITSTVATDPPSLTGFVDGNQVRLTQNGIHGRATNCNGSMTLTVTNNTVTNMTGSGARPGIRIDGNLSATGDVNVCVDIRNNAAEGIGTACGVAVRKQGTTFTVNDFKIVGMPAGPNTLAAVESYLSSQNPASTVGFNGLHAFVLSGDNFGSCTP